jgi:hypothetical protein
MADMAEGKWNGFTRIPLSGHDAVEVTPHLNLASASVGQCVSPAQPSRYQTTGRRDALPYAGVHGEGRREGKS